MRNPLSLAALALALAAGACDQLATVPDAPLSGRWTLQVTDYQRWGSQIPWTCDLAGTLTLVEREGRLEGVTDQPRVVCTHTGTGQVSVDSAAGPWAVRGEVQDGRIHFSLSGGFHSFGEVPPGRPERIAGYLESYAGVEPVGAVTERSGSFVLARLP